MSLTVFLIYLAVGRLLIWLLQIAGLMRPIWGLHPLLTELSECDLCLGFWIYLALAIFLDSPFHLWPFPLEVVGFAAISTFLAHLLRIGWQTKFGITVIE